MRNKTVATYQSGTNEIWDYRGIPLGVRIRIAIALILYGVVEINWKGANNIFWSFSKKLDAVDNNEVQK